MNSEQETILYIDDEVENLRGFQFLYRAHYKIFIAQSADEGFEILRNNNIKLILADQRMPKMTGVDFFEQASVLYPDIIRIIITGYADIEAIIKAINKGKIFKYVTKPWDKDELKLIIDNALWSYNISSENRNLIQSLKEVNIQLEEANQSLEQKVVERTNEILRQKKEIEDQRDLAKHQRDQIAAQNIELEKHHNQLEQIVAERTADLVKAKEKAELSDKLKSAFLANLSHEIRTPMNAIMGFSQLLAFRDIGEDEKKEFIDLIVINSKYLLNLINEIIDISRIEAGEMTLSYSNCNLNQMFHEILNQYEEQKALINKNNISIRTSPSLNLKDYSISTDVGKMRQVLVNLIENALKFTENGYIEFGCLDNSEDNSDEITLYVRDSGIGIDEESINFIFERFRKVENEKADKLYRGAGLGLSISKRLVDLLGGKIWVESEIDKGSTFYFTLPKGKILDKEVKQEVVAVSNPIKSEYNWPNKLILVAEDELINCKFIEKVLSNTSINLLWAKNGLETCEYIEQNKNIDLILMDIRMPIMDGYEATRKIKKMRNDLPIIAQTAYALEYEKDEILKAGCDDYISKPYSDKELLSVINKYLRTID